MSKKYEQRTKKGKRKREKEIIKPLNLFRIRINPIIDIAVCMMINEELKNKKGED